MSRAFIAEIIQESTGSSSRQAMNAAADLVDAIVEQLKSEGKFTVPGFGTFKLRETTARQAKNPRTGAPIKIKAGRTVRFKVSSSLKAVL